MFYNNKAAVYVELKEFEKAIEACELALKVKEDNSIYDYKKIAKIFARLGSIYEK